MFNFLFYLYDLGEEIGGGNYNENSLISDLCIGLILPMVFEAYGYILRKNPLLSIRI